MTVAAPTLTDAAIKSRLGEREEFVIEVFDDASFKFETEAAFEARTKEKRSGRLGRMTFEFDTADHLNQNRRVYPAAAFNAAHAPFTSRVNENVVFGNLDHPHPWDPHALQVRLGDACVKIAETKMVSDKRVQLVCDILDNEHGRQLLSTMDVGGNPGISQRGIAEWREPTKEEREHYGVPDGEYMVVADSLRLITYDIVSEPGFSGASGAKVTESKKVEITQEIGASTMDRNKLAAEHPTLLQALITEGRTAALGELPAKIDEAVTQRKPQIVEEAIKPLNEQLAAAKQANEAMLADLATVKAVLVKHKIVNEQITDAQAAAQISTLTAKNADLESKLAEATKVTTEMKAAQQAQEKKQAIRTNLETISAAYKDSRHHDAILTHVAKQQIADSKLAIEAANEVATLLRSAAPENSGGSIDTKATGNSFSNVLDGLLHSNPADTGAGSSGYKNNGGRQPANEGLAGAIRTGCSF